MRPLALFLLAATTLSASPAFDDAVGLYKQRKDAEARTAFEALLQTEPKNAEIPYYLGRLDLRAKDTDAAVAHFQAAVALDGAKSAYHLELGGAYGNQAQSAGLFGKAALASKARTEFEKAVALDPSSYDAQSALFQYYMQAPGFMGGGFDKALAQSEVLIKLDPLRGKNAKVALLVRERKFDEAFAIFDEMLRANPDDYAALYGLGRTAADSGQRLDAGLTNLQKCLTLTPPAGLPPHAAAHWRIGNIHEKKGDKAAARAAYQASLALDPKFQPAIDSLKKLG
ncbi:MAG: tetratricopeptide repeat protein [Candidatus Didemnitutus sp.]|nr:tetratricopeptide repeat protein [Candidatus Didemnitutus sp.]